MHFVDAKGILTGGKGRFRMNIYRGCLRGCIYCDSRSLCYQFTCAFEDIEVKRKMGSILTKDGIRLHYNEYGTGEKVLLSAQGSIYPAGMQQALAEKETMSSA